MTLTAQFPKFQQFNGTSLKLVIITILILQAITIFLMQHSDYSISGTSLRICETGTWHVTNWIIIHY